MEETYNSRAGEEVTKGAIIGLICGYNETSSKLILAVTTFPSSEDEDGNTVGGSGWTKISEDDTIVTNADNELGYHYINA